MYYNITLAYEPKVIGVRNGIYQVVLMENLFSKDSYKKMEMYFITKEFSAIEHFPDFDVHFYFKKLKSAKETSFVSFCPHLNHCHFLIKNEVLNVLKMHNIQSYEVYPTTIYNSNNESVDNSYKMFYSVLQDWDVIDFGKSVFTTGGYGNVPLLEHQFSNQFELNSCKRIARVKTLVLSENFDSTLDFFHTRLGGIFISERLKIALEAANFTGLIFSNKIHVLH